MQLWNFDIRAAGSEGQLEARALREGACLFDGRPFNVAFQRGFVMHIRRDAGTNALSHLHLHGDAPF